MSRDAPQPNALGRYRTYDPPPADFDPLTAPDRELKRHGLPRRPDPEREPQLAEIWGRVFARPITFVRAELAVDPRRGDRNPLWQEVADPAPSNWAGAIRYNPGPGQSFGWVFAEWVIPEVVQKKRPWDDEMGIAFWVGIDGRLNQQVVQAGLAARVTTSWSWLWPLRRVDWWAWTQWQTDDSHPILNFFPLAAGQTVSFLLCVSEPELATVTMVNATTGVATIVTVDAPAGYTAKGQTAEWIVEGFATGLPEFLPFTFNECLAGKANEFAFVDVTNAMETNIEGASGVPITDAHVMPPRSVTVSWKANK